MRIIDQIRKNDRKSVDRNDSNHVMTDDTAGFIIRPAVSCDIPGIMKVMEEAASDTEHPEWFVSDDEAYVREHLKDCGFVAVAEEEKTHEIAGFFMIKYPLEEEWHPGRGLPDPSPAAGETAVMDSAAVLAKYRGNGLQSRLLVFCEEMLKGTGRKYFVCTIHPDNIYSRSNMERHGYGIMLQTKCYGGKDRLILLKTQMD